MAAPTGREVLEEAILAGGEAKANLPALVGDVISEDTLWSCTTCGYCEAACPIELELLPKFYRLRQHRERTVADRDRTVADATRLGAQVLGPARRPFRGDRVIPHEIGIAHNHAAEVLRPGAIDICIDKGMTNARRP